MSLAELLPLPVVLPICGAIAAPLLARLHGRLPLIVGLLALLGALGVLAAQATDVYDGHVLTNFLGREPPVHGHALGIALAADPFGITFALLAAAIGSLLLLSVLSELGHLGAKELGGLACLMQLLLAALIGAALTADTVNLFVWFEVAALASYGLTGFFLERPIALEAAFKNLVLTNTAGFMVFIGAAMLYTRTGALNFGQLHLATAGMPTSRAALVAIALLVSGFATKAGLVPFHAWLPDTHTPVPGAVSALFSALMVDLGIVALTRLSLQVFPAVPHLLELLTGLGVASALVGALLTLVQDDLKRLLAWDTVSQMGVLIIGFASQESKGVAGALFHMVNHGLFKALLFLCAGGIVHATGLTQISEMGGLARHRPVTTVAFLLGCLAISGIPPLDGYASLGLIHEGLTGEPVVLGCALVAQVITIAALGRAAWLAFLRKRAEPYEHLEPELPGMRVSLVILAAGCIASGVLAAQFVKRVAAPAASMLLHPGAYAHAALGNRSRVPPLPLTFDYFKGSTMLTSGIEIAAGLILLVLVLRVPAFTRPINVLRRMHTGSVNDYAAYAAIGAAIATYALLA
jgi:multicomponent Na+:H+ antiporter subunit D